MTPWPISGEDIGPALPTDSPLWLQLRRMATYDEAHPEVLRSNEMDQIPPDDEYVLDEIYPDD